MSSDTDTGSGYDVAIVGGGPAGCSTGVFTGRYGLDTVIFDRGRSSLGRIAHLENYLGFPGGIDTGTFYELVHAHAERAGCEVVETLVETVRRNSDGFEVRTADGRTVTADRVVAASKYDHDYLHGVAERTLFTTETYDGEEYELLDRDAIDAAGRTSVDGLYATGSLATDNTQVQQQAGHGASVALGIITDRRRERGYPDELAEAYHDWVVVEGGYGDDGWDEELREQFDEALPESHSLSEERVDQLREQWVAEHRSWEIPAAERERRRRDGQRRLAAALDDELLLDSVSDDLILERARELADQSAGSVGEIR